MSSAARSSYEDVSSPHPPNVDSSVELIPVQNSHTHRFPVSAELPKLPATRCAHATRRNKWINFVHIPAFAVAYASHRYYRRCKPLRIRPKLTSLRLSEIYLFVAATLSVGADTYCMQRNMIYHDEDLLVIELAAHRFRAGMHAPESRAVVKLFRDSLAEFKAESPCLRLREGEQWESCSHDGALSTFRAQMPTSPLAACGRRWSGGTTICGRMRSPGRSALLWCWAGWKEWGGATRCSPIPTRKIGYGASHI